MVSTVTGAWATEEQLSDPDYWAIHVRQTVRFSDAARRLLDQPDLILLEVGPGQTLSVARAPAANAPPPTDSCSRRSAIRARRSATRSRCSARSAQVWAAGGIVDWAAVHGGRRQVVPLPTYPFDHERYWIDPVTAPPGEARARARPAAPTRSRAAPTAVNRPSPRGQLLPSPPTTPRRPPSPPMPRDGLAAGPDRRPAGRILSELSGIDPAALDPDGELRRPRLRLAVPHPGERPVPQAVRGADHVPPALRGGAVDRLARRRSSTPSSHRTHSRVPNAKARRRAWRSQPTRHDMAAAEAGSVGVGADVDGTSHLADGAAHPRAARIMEQQLDCSMSQARLARHRRDGRPRRRCHRPRPPRPPRPRRRPRPTGHYLATRDQGTAARRATAP